MLKLGQEDPELLLRWKVIVKCQCEGRWRITAQLDDSPNLVGCSALPSRAAALHVAAQLFADYYQQPYEEAPEGESQELEYIQHLSCTKTIDETWILHSLVTDWGVEFDTLEEVRNALNAIFVNVPERFRERTKKGL